MKHKLRNFSQRYQAALRKHLKLGSRSNLESARKLGSHALAAGLQTLDLAKIHEQALVTHLLPDCPESKRALLIRQAGIFFAMASLPIELTHHSAREATAQLEKVVETLSERTVELAASNLELSLEITQRKSVEKALKNSERHSSQLLEESHRLQEQLRRVSRQILSAQEDERRRISRELHDVIAQTLTGINIRLAGLKKDAALNTKGLDRKIASTQRLVEQSVNIVHRFARDLRPAVLDDLGLIPALHSYMKSFTARTGVRIRLKAVAAVEKLGPVRRAVLYRIAQEALSNVARHAKASEVDVTIQKLPDCIRMKIKDDGKSFNVKRVLRDNRGKRLGLLGMRERMEMVGGRFAIESTPGKGSTIIAEIPSDNGHAPVAKHSLLKRPKSQLENL